MVDDRSMRFREGNRSTVYQRPPAVPPRPPRPMPQPVEPTPSTSNRIDQLMRGTDTNLGYSQANQDLVNRRGGELFLSPFSTLTDEAKNTGALQRGTPASGALSTAAFLADLVNPSFGLPIGVGGVAGARAAAPVVQGASALRDVGMKGIPALATAAGNPAAAMAVAGRTVDDVLREPGPMQAALLRYLGRHRSSERSLNDLVHPDLVPISGGRAYGPPTYFAQTPSLSDDSFSGFGPYIYRMAMGPKEWARTAKSKGYIDDNTLMNTDLKFGDFGLSRPENTTRWADPSIQSLLDEGYLGYKHGDAFTDWMVGVTPGLSLKRTGTSTNPNLYGARNIMDKASEAGRRVVDSVAEGLGGVGATKNMPPALADFVKNRLMVPQGEGFSNLRQPLPYPQLSAFLRRLGLDKKFKDKVDDFSDPYFDEVL
jgi:hypothetical protein